MVTLPVDHHPVAPIPAATPPTRSGASTRTASNRSGPYDVRPAPSRRADDRALEAARWEVPCGAAFDERVILLVTVGRWKGRGEELVDFTRRPMGGRRVVWVADTWGPARDPSVGAPRPVAGKTRRVR